MLGSRVTPDKEVRYKWAIFLSCILCLFTPAPLGLYLASLPVETEVLTQRDQWRLCGHSPAHAGFHLGPGLSPQNQPDGL